MSALSWWPRGGVSGWVATPPKQYQPIDGVPVVLRALRPFVSHPDVAQVVLVFPPDDAEPPTFLSPSPSFPALSVVAGGRRAGDSVRAGLRHSERLQSYWFTTPPVPSSTPK